MARTNRNLTEKITIQITRPMPADLQNVATKSGKPLAEIVRQAIHNALDGTNLTLGTEYVWGASRLWQGWGRDARNQG